MPYDRICPDCKAPFTAYRKQQPRCRRCARKWSCSIWRAKHRPPRVRVGDEIPCPVCEVKFTVHGNRSVYCCRKCREHAKHLRRLARKGKRPKYEGAGLIARRAAAIRQKWTEQERLKRIVDADRAA